MFNNLKESSPVACPTSDQKRSAEKARCKDENVYAHSFERDPLTRSEFDALIGKSKKSKKAKKPKRHKKSKVVSKKEYIRWSLVVMKTREIRNLLLKNVVKIKKSMKLLPY